MATGVIYSGYDNAPVLVFEDDGEVYDLSPATKISVRIDGQSFNTVDDPGKFDTSDLAGGRLGLKFGGASIAPGDYPIRVVVEGAGYPDGRVWCHENDGILTIVRVQ